MKHPRWVVARLEEGELGSNPRFIISSRYDDGFKLYNEQYCARGDMENRIQDQQLCLFADRTSITHWWTNQWRLILSGFAYTLFERLRIRVLMSDTYPYKDELSALVRRLVPD